MNIQNQISTTGLANSYQSIIANKETTPPVYSIKDPMFALNPIKSLKPSTLNTKSNNPMSVYTANRFRYQYPHRLIIISRVLRDSTPRHVRQLVGPHFTLFYVFAVFGFTAPAQMLW